MATNPVLETIHRRRSTRSFTDRQVSGEDLHEILAAGRQAPSARNQQKWHFTVVQSPTLLAALNRDAKAAATASGDAFAQQRGADETFNIFYDAPTLILVSGDPGGSVMQLDCAAANQNMLLAAESLGLGGCWINFVLFVFRGPKGDHYRQALGIPTGYAPVCGCVVGYRAGIPGPAPERNSNVVNIVA